MGLFSQRPEEPTEWAGLPSEPARVETTAERLTDAAAVDLGGLGVGGLGLGGVSSEGMVESIAIPVALHVDTTEPRAPGDDEDGPRIRR